MGGGLRAAGLDTTSLSPAAPVTDAKNAEVDGIRVTSELARSRDTFALCTGCGVGKGRGAPVWTRTPQNQLSTEKHTGFGRVFFVILPDGARRLYFTMNNQLRDDQVFPILARNWSNPLLAPGPPKGDSGRSQESSGGPYI